MLQEMKLKQFDRELDKLMKNSRKSRKRKEVSSKSL
jgi:hypothetical protein